MNPDQKDLLQKAGRSIQPAKVLMAEGFPGFAVSRAYYAMFYITQALLEKKGLSFTKHSAVIAVFGKYFIKTGIIQPEYHRYLIDAMEARHEGDYSPHEEINPKKASEYILKAEKFLQLGVDFLTSNQEDIHE